MLTACRIESIEEVVPMSHGEFLYRTVIYQLTQLSDGRSFRVRMPKKESWKIGQIVSLEESTLEAGLL